jgi:hypothetical protein
MDSTDNSRRWFQPFRPAREHVAVEHDAADLGTCFGLDMSLESPEPAAVATAARAPWWAPWSQRGAAPGAAD